MRTLSLMALLLMACEAFGPDLPPLELPDGCNPLLGGADCFVPYPSDIYLVDDPTLPSGKRVRHLSASKLITHDGETADVGDWRPLDGFSRNPTIMFTLGRATAETGLVRMDDDLDQSRRSDSTTLVLEAETGRAIAHFVDVDPFAEEAAKVPFLIRPMEAMKEQTRYVVAVQGLRDLDGDLLPSPPGFLRLQEGVAVGGDEWADLPAHYEAEIFPVLAEFGLNRDDLQLAWDFTTGSDQSLTQDMFAIRALALEWAAANDPVVTIRDVVERDEDDKYWRVIRGTIEGPLYMEADAQGAAIHRDAAGQPSQNGTAPFRFIAVVPRSLRDRWAAGRIINFGHGFFGSPGEVEGGGVQGIAESTESIFFAIRWKGMAELDAAVMVADMADFPPQILRFGDRVHQAMANWIISSDAIETVLHDLPAFRRPLEAELPGVSVNEVDESNAGQALYDTGFQGFVGISQGHILGGVLAALNPYITRLVLNVGGAAFTHMMSRAGPFASYLAIITTVVQEDAFERQKLLTTLARVFDRFDPATYARYVLDNKQPGAPADRRVLLQIGYADAQVPDFASFFHARLLGIPFTEPSARNPWGLEKVSLPFAGSALTLFDFPHVDAAFRQLARPTVQGNEVHEAVRRLEGAKQQIDQFLRPGLESQIIHPCDGACDPE